MRYINNTKRYKPGDWLVSDDITGAAVYFSKVKKLGRYTGLGGLYTMHYNLFKDVGGLMPYTVPAEKPIPLARPKNINITFDNLSIDVEDVDPMSISNPEDEA